MSIAEVEDNDVWQRAVLGLAVVGNERRFVESALDEVIRFVRSQAEVINAEREIQSFSDALAENDLGFQDRRMKERIPRLAMEIREILGGILRARRSRIRGCRRPD